jgi:acyl dehydratase
MKETKLPEGTINEESLAEFRRRVGIELRVNRGNELACRETITKWMDGIGDVNPLYRDEDYAAKTKYGRVVAHPSWLYSVFATFVQQGLPGVHAFHSGNDWEFYKPILMGDKIQPKAKFTGFDEKTSKFAGKMIMEYQEATYYNQRDELIAKAKSWLVRAERKAARGTGKYSSIELPHPWTEEELEKVEDEVLAEDIRGDKIRYWEDVNIGDELPPLVKGPLGLSDEFAFMAAGLAGSGGMPPANGAALRMYRAHPNWGFRDQNTYALEPIAGVHWNYEAAKFAGLPYPYDVGIQRNSWVLQFLTDYIGDEGWIKSCHAEYRFFFYFSDVIWFRGKITDKYKDDQGEYCLDLEITAFNQRGENTTPGNATIILPSKEAKTFPLGTRLPKD